jgi:site-specific DNA recombinase
VLQQPASIAHALERAHHGAWVPEELRRRQATLRGVRASLVRQRERLLQAYLAEEGITNRGRLSIAQRRV